MEKGNVKLKHVLVLLLLFSMVIGVLSTTMASYAMDNNVKVERGCFN